jgi:dienelactone hydrolase
VNPPTTSATTPPATTVYLILREYIEDCEPAAVTTTLATAHAWIQQKDPAARLTAHDPLMYDSARRGYGWSIVAMPLITAVPSHL